MSNTKKTVQIKESKLVDMINNIVEQAITEKKKEWIAEQAKSGDKSAILESKINALETKINQLSKCK